jgi:hypothetical protein
VAAFEIEGDNLVLRLKGWEKAAGFHGNISVPLSAIQSVRVVQTPWLDLRGWRMAGTGIPPFIMMGTRRHAGGFDFCAIRRNQPAVEVDVATGRFGRLLLGVPEEDDPAALADRIAGAAGIARA